MFCVFLAIFCALFGVHSEVLKLTKENYEETLKKGNVFIKFFSPTCPHCREVAPTYETLSNNFKKYEDRVTIAEVDCTQFHSICDKADVKGYPTFYFYKTNDKKDRVEYNGDRSIDDFSTFLGDKIGVFYRPKPKLLKEVTPDTWNDTVMDLSKNVLVAFTAPWCGHCKRLKPQMEMAANSFKPEENISFVYIDAEKYNDFCSPYEVRGYPTIKFFPASTPEDAQALAEKEQKAQAKAEENKKREERKAVLEALKAAAKAENATEEEKAAFTDEMEAELKEIKTNIIVDENTVEPPKKGSSLVEPFTGTRSGAGLVSFMNKRVGTLRALGGGVDPFAGLERDLAEPLVRYVHSVTGTPLPKEETEEKKEEEKPADAKKEEEKKDEGKSEEKKEEEPKKEEAEVERVPPPPVNETRAVVEQLLTKVSSPYVVSQFKRYMALLEEKGLPALDAERERVSKILESGHFTDKKTMEFTVRKNVLSLFMTI